MLCLCSRSQRIVSGVLLGKGDPDGCVGGGGGGGGGRNSKDEMLGEGEKKKKNEGLAR